MSDPQPTIIPTPTPDQAEYLKRIIDTTGKFDPNVMIRGNDPSKTTITHEQELAAFSTALARAEDTVMRLRAALTRIANERVYRTGEWLPTAPAQIAIEALKELDHAN